MTTAPLPAELSAAAPGIAARLGAILVPLAALIARAFLRDPRRVALILPLWRYLTHAARRFDRLVARLAAGTETRLARSGGSGPRPVRLPAAHGWLVADLRHEAVVYMLRLETLLAEPATAALLAHSPQAARLLRPLCCMLGVRATSLPSAPSRQPASRPAPAPPALPGPVAPGTEPRADAPRERPRLCDPPCEHVRWPWFPRYSAATT